MKYLLLVSALQYAGVFSATTSMHLMQAWKQIDFIFPSTSERNYAIQNKLFVPANVFPIDVDVDYHGSIDDWLNVISISDIWI